MTRTSIIARRLMIVGSVVILGATFALSAKSQTAPAAPPPAAGGLSPARQAVDDRRAVYKLIGNNFKPLGAVLKGSPYEATTVQKSITRLVFLSGLIDDAFPDISNIGEPETKAKPDVWTNRADFDKKVKEFQTHLIALQLLNDTDKAATEAFKTAATAVAQDCKECHDTYRAK
ncbi:MAG TPA: cytochrome c [Methylocella sp.]|nr:cytochrome c [Methylocella sp.]